MSKLSHSCDETMEAIMAAAIERDERGEWDEPPRKEYPQREIFMRGGCYIQCQILNWDSGEPPKYLACHALDGTLRTFIASHGYGTWAEVNIHDVARALNLSVTAE